MKQIHASLNSGTLEVTPANVTVNVKNVRPYTKTEMKNLSDALRMAERIYKVQVERTCNVRFKCLELCAAKKFENKNLFWTLFMQRADSLLDSRRFIAEAKKLGANPILLATNIVARGFGLVNQVSKFGIDGAGIDVSEYCCSLVPDEIVQRFMSTPEGLFPEMEEEQEEDHVPTAKKEQPVVPVAEAQPAA